MTANIPRPTLTKKPPGAVHFYFDKIAVWLRQPASPDDIRRLRRHAGHLYVTNTPARFGQGFRQRLEFKQPDSDVIAFLATRSDALVNAIEFSFDLAFADVLEREEAFEFLHRHLVRRWHGRRQQVRFVGAGAEEAGGGAGGTRYDGTRAAPNRLVLYQEEASRITGEVVPLLHLEWRANGVRAVTAAGVASVVDLVGFDHQAFWRHRLRLLEVIDNEKLGRLIRQAQTGRKEGPIVMEGYGVSADSRFGLILMRYHSVQEIIDDYGRGLRQERVSPAGWMAWGGWRSRRR